MSRIDRMVSAIDPAAGSAEPAVSQGVHDLLAEIVATQPPHGLPRLRRRLLAGAAVTVTAAAALIIVPLATGAENPAYAVTRQPDGSVHIKINEFRDPGSLERDLARLGIKAKIWFTPPGKMCSRNFTSADPQIPLEELTSADPEVQAAARRKMADSPSRQAFQIEQEGGIRVFPDRIKQGQTAVMEFIEDSGQASDRPEKPRVLWSFSFQLANGPVGECVLTDNPGWNDVGDPEDNPGAFPPPGS